MSDQASEPTMDDILASIRRIISEDEGSENPTEPENNAQENLQAQPSQQGQNMPLVDDDDDDVVVLTKPAPSQAKAKVEPAPQVPEIEPKAEPAPTLIPAKKPTVQSSNLKPAFKDDAVGAARKSRKGPSLDSLDIDETESKVRSLGSSKSVMKPSNMRRADRGLDNAFSDERLLSATTETLGTASFASLERAVRMGKAGDTLEDVVRNLLRPMLRGWIDQNLPSLVERMVQTEIQKIVSGARRNWEDSDL